MREEVWLYPGMAHSTSSGQAGAWHFVSVSKKVAKEIKAKHEPPKRRGFTPIPVIATVGQTSWETSIFPDKKSGTYLLPLKAQVRKKEGIFAGDKLTYSIKIR